MKKIYNLGASFDGKNFTLSSMLRSFGLRNNIQVTMFEGEYGVHEFAYYFIQP